MQANLNQPSPQSTITSTMILLRRNQTDPIQSNSNSQSHTLSIDETNTIDHHHHHHHSNPHQFILGSTSLTDEPPSQSEHSSDSNPQNSINSDKPLNRLDPTVVEAMMTGTVRDKQILLQAQVEMVRFVTSTQDRQPFGAALSTSLNSYQRMLVHRLGDSFGIKRSMAMGHMFIERTPLSACPSTRLDSFIIRQDASPSKTTLSPREKSPSSNIPLEEKTTPIVSSQNTNQVKVNSATTSNVPLKTFKIMSRTPSQRSSSRQTSKAITTSTGSSVSSGDATNSDTKRNELSYEARQAAYQQARNRIFAAGTSESAEDDGIPKGSSESEETTSSSRNLDDHMNDESNPSQDQSMTSSNDLLIGNGPIRLAQALNKGKEKMMTNSKPLKQQTTVAKLRPGATAFDPNAKAHGYEEVTIIDFDDSHGPITWPSAPNGYEYPSEPISRQTFHSRQIRSAQLYGNSDPFPGSLHSTCAPLNGESTVPYSMFSPSSNGSHYIDSPSGMNPMVPYEDPSQRIFPPTSGAPSEVDHHRYHPHPQNLGFPTSTSSIPRSINPGPILQPRIPIRQDRFNLTPFPTQHGLNNEIEVGRGMSSKETTMMMGHQGSDRLRGTHPLSSELNSVPTRSLTVPPPPTLPTPEHQTQIQIQTHPGLNVNHHSLSFPSLHSISTNHQTSIPTVHMNHPTYSGIQSNHHHHHHHHPFDSQFQTPIPSLHPTSNRDLGPQSSSNLTNPTHFHPPRLVTEPPTTTSSYPLDLNHHSRIDYSPLVSSFNGNQSNPIHLGSSTSNNLNGYSTGLSVPTTPLKYDSTYHPSCSSISDETCSSHSSNTTNRTGISSLSKRQPIKLNESGPTKLIKGGGGSSFGQLGVFGNDGLKSRFEGGPGSGSGSVGGVSNCGSSCGSVNRNHHRNKSKKDENSQKSGNRDDVHQNSTVGGKLSQAAIGFGSIRSVGSGSTHSSSDTNHTNLSSHSSDIGKSLVGSMVGMQHPLPAKPLWIGSHKLIGRNGNGNGKQRGGLKSNEGLKNENESVKLQSGLLGSKELKEDLLDDGNENQNQIKSLHELESKVTLLDLETTSLSVLHVVDGLDKNEMKGSFQ